MATDSKNLVTITARILPEPRPAHPTIASMPPWHAWCSGAVLGITDEEMAVIAASAIDDPRRVHLFGIGHAAAMRLAQMNPPTASIQ